MTPLLLPAPDPARWVTVKKDGKEMVHVTTIIAKDPTIIEGVTKNTAVEIWLEKKAIIAILEGAEGAEDALIELFERLRPDIRDFAIEVIMQRIENFKTKYKLQ